jgi:quinoprotein glucose dehydrogenase
LQGISVDDLIDLTPALRAEALEIVKGYRLGPLFNSPMVSGQGGLEATIGEACPG